MKFTFSQHALQQMFRRGISINQVKKCIENGETIKEYDYDKPYPSKLNLLIEKEFTLHVVFAINKTDKEYIIITAYNPNPEIWENDYRTKK